MTEQRGVEKKKRGPADTFMDLLHKESVMNQIKAALPKFISPERFARMALTVFRRNTGLQKCNMESVFGCLIQAAELGLELSGPLGQAWMVPYGPEATFQVGYRGYFDLAFRSGKVLTCPMRVRHEADDWRISYGSEQRLIHMPADGDRGEAVGYYTCVYLRGGGVDFEYMSKNEIAVHRGKYVKNTRADSPWNTAFDAMALKTTARRLFKRVPVSVEIGRAVTYDEYEEQGLMQHRPETGLTRTEIVGAKLGAVDEAASEPERGQEGGAGKPATKKQLGTIRGHLARLGLAEGEGFEGVPLDELTAEEADSLLHTLTQRPTPPSEPPGVGDPMHDPDLGGDQ